MMFFFVLFCSIPVFIFFVLEPVWVQNVNFLHKQNMNKGCFSPMIYVIVNNGQFKSKKKKKCLCLIFSKMLHLSVRTITFGTTRAKLCMFICVFVFVFLFGKLMILLPPFLVGWTSVFTFVFTVPVYK